MHPRYGEIIQVLDKSISSLLLRPSTSDASLETIQSLLLYLQWMPYDLHSGLHGRSIGHVPFATRYNEMSAWTIFGLALRYANFCGTEHKVLSTFGTQEAAAEATKEDLGSMRVWLNLVTYDCNLTLTSGLPASLDPRSVNEAVGHFYTHPLSQMPGDVRYASMVQLACIISDVRREKDKIAQRNQVIAVVTQANEQFDAWQKYVKIFSS